MACGGAKVTPESKAIDEALKKDQAKRAKLVNLLLLGPGESGKSTVSKQMKIIHLAGFTKEEKEAYREVVYSNIVSAVKVLHDAARRFGYEVADPARAGRVAALESIREITPAVWQDLIATWRDPALARAWKRAAEFQLSDSAKYFYDRVEAIAATADYVPTQEDILNARQMTTGICEMEWDWDTFRFRMVDVGGQRNHRSKWIHCFDGVHAVIFCVALSEYDQVLREDVTVNRMHEALSLFETLVNSEWFCKVPFLIFFNKKDLFQTKIKEVDLAVCWPEYTGGKSEEPAFAFIKQRFEEMDEKRIRSRQIYSHQTCAIDTANIAAVFEVSRHILIQKSIGTVFQ
jgi:GTPase SAR1 family protein